MIHARARLSGPATESTPMNRSISYWREAEQCRELRCWDRADELFQEAVASDPGPEIHVAYGTFLAERQAIRPAIAQLMQGLDGAQATGNLDLQAVVFSNLAILYRQSGDHDLAQRFQRQVLAIQGAADAGDLLNWSADALLAGKTKLAENLARNGFQLVEDSDDIETQADLYGSQGIAAARSGKLRKAVKLLIRAARGHQYVDDDRGLGADYLNLAEICGLMGRQAWQRAFLSAARDGFDRAGMPQSVQRVDQRIRDADRLEHYRQVDAQWN